MIKRLLKNNWLYIIGALIGAVGGYFYWVKIGCLSGACPLTSSPLLSILWGTVIGILLFSMFKKKTINE